MNEKSHGSLVLPEQEDQAGHALPARSGEWRRAKIALTIVLLLLALGAARTIINRVLQGHAVDQTTQANAVVYVNVVTPKQTNGAGNITLLPATLRGFVESPIYARATGYLLHWYADIGTRVKQGQLLADLDTPEIDQELKQAIAQQDQMQASVGLAKSSAQRWEELRQHDAVSQQALDERESSLTQDQSNLAAAQANVQRLRQLESFKRIVAPFDGVITQRNVDVGDLIDAGSGSSRALFALAQSNPLRAYVQMPQAYAENVAVGQQVDVTQAELPDKKFVGTISHISGAIDVPTRSLQIEVRLANPDGALRPGAYVQVAVPAALHANLLVPGNALLFRAQGPQVAVLTKQGVVQLRKITIAQDLGDTLELDSGLDPTDRVIINPSDSIANGDRVQIAPPQPVSGAAAAKGAAS